MRFTTQSHYPVPSSTVVKMFCDVGFHKRRLTELEGQNWKIVSSETTANIFSLRVERRIAMNIPGLGRGLDAIMAYDELWNADAMTGFVKVDTKGMPLKIACEAKLANEMKGCVVVYSWTVDSGVPLIGRRIEKAVQVDLAGRFEREAAFGLRQVDRYR